MAELHVCGQIAEASGFAGSNLFCEWDTLGDFVVCAEGVRARTQAVRCCKHIFTSILSYEIRKTSLVLVEQWGIAAGESWEVLEGFESARTQADAASGSATWAHPIDVHLAAKGMAGWPKLHFQVWSRQKAGRAKIRGYGFCHVPTTAGVHKLSCSTWVPQESMTDRLFSRVAGGGMQLKYENIVHSPEDRYRLQTRSSGTVKLELNVVTRKFHHHHVHLN